MSPSETTATSSTTTIPAGETGTVRASVDTVRKLGWLDTGPGHIVVSTAYLSIAIALTFALPYVSDPDSRPTISMITGLLIGVFKDAVTRFFQKPGDNQ